jgi:hypothetical protein
MDRYQGRWEALSGSTRDLIVDRDPSSESLTYHLDGRMGEEPFCIVKEPSTKGVSFVLEDQARSLLLMYENGRKLARFKLIE